MGSWYGSFSPKYTAYIIFTLESSSSGSGFVVDISRTIERPKEPRETQKNNW
jgi:hypothetical protein